MTLETIARVPAGFPVERVLPHPRLPLLACVDADRPAVHVLDRQGGRLGTIGADAAAYDPAAPWKRRRLLPAVAWHPAEPLLVVSAGSEVLRWTPDGVSTMDVVPAGARYYSMAFSPDGAALWASPPSSDEPDAWDRSEVVDLASGTVGRGLPWDTGIAEHPAGGLLATLRSDQGATLLVFAEPGAGLRSRALILDADGYERPMFSPDGRYLAITGNAYENLLQVFEFPSLRRILATGLGEAGSLRAVAFGAGALWVGRPDGTLAGIDLDGRPADEHALSGSAVTALAATAPGELIAAAGDELVFLARAGAVPDPGASRVAEFLAATTEVSDEDDLEKVPAATVPEPTWLRLQAALDARG